MQQSWSETSLDYSTVKWLSDDRFDFCDTITNPEPSNAAAPAENIPAALPEPDAHNRNLCEIVQAAFKVPTAMPHEIAWYTTQPENLCKVCGGSALGAYRCSVGHMVCRSCFSASLMNRGDASSLVHIPCTIAGCTAPPVHVAAALKMATDEAAAAFIVNMLYRATAVSRQQCTLMALNQMVETERCERETIRSDMLEATVHLMSFKMYTITRFAVTSVSTGTMTDPVRVGRVQLDAKAPAFQPHRVAAATDDLHVYQHQPYHHAAVDFFDDAEELMTYSTDGYDDAPPPYSQYTIYDERIDEHEHDGWTSMFEYEEDDDQGMNNGELNYDPTYSALDAEAPEFVPRTAAIASSGGGSICGEAESPNLLPQFVAKPLNPAAHIFVPRGDSAFKPMNPTAQEFTPRLSFTNNQCTVKGLNGDSPGTDHILTTNTAYPSLSATAKEFTPKTQ